MVTTAHAALTSMWNAGFPPPNTYIRSKLSLWRSSPAHVPAQWSTRTTLKSCTLCNPMASAVTCIAVSFSESCLQQAPSPAPSVSSGPGLISAQIALVLEFIQFLCSHSMFVFAFSLCSVQPDLSGVCRGRGLWKMFAHASKYRCFDVRVCICACVCYDAKKDCSRSWKFTLTVCKLVGA